MDTRPVTVSVVSHRQNALVNHLLADLERHCSAQVAKTVVTVNAPDPEPILNTGPDLPLHVIRNSVRQGFGANHNAAFVHCATPYFCVINPDVRISVDPFPALIKALAAQVGVAAPLVRSAAGAVEDSARRFPTFGTLLAKAVFSSRGTDYSTDAGTQYVDWVAGMFMLFPSPVFRRAGGFDPAYFLYYEDIDICVRLQLDDQRCTYVPSAEIVHDARRESRRNLRYAWWHARSMVRYLTSRPYRKLRQARKTFAG